MPALLSPRGKTDSKDDTEPMPTLKKKKSMMGMLKSKISTKLGRKKSLTDMTASPTAQDLTDKKASIGPENSEFLAVEDQDISGTSVEEQEQQMRSGLPLESKHQEPPASETIISPFDASIANEEEAFIAADNVDDEKSPALATQVESKGLSEYEDEQYEDEEVLTVEEPPMTYQVVDDDDEEEEEQLEVFEDLGNQTSSRESLHDVPSQEELPPEQDQQEQDSLCSSRHDLDLTVIGRSPMKRDIPSSPVKRINPSMSRISEPTSPEECEVLDSIADQSKEEERDDAVRGSRSSSATFSSSEQTLSPHSPMKRMTNQPKQPLLSEFQFGAERGAKSPRSSSAHQVPPSPKKRSSFTRDQEQRVATNVQESSSSSTGSNSTKKQMSMAKKKFSADATAATAHPVSSRTASNPQHPKLQGIEEEQQDSNAVSVAHPESPRRIVRETRARRRSSFIADAPIFASASFTDQATDLAGQTTSEPQAEDSAEPKEEGQSSSSFSAFAFDAGAAITQEFGERVARLLGADPWGDRQDGFDAIQYHLKKTDLSTAKNRRELLCASLAAAQCGVEDRVAPVMYCALECLGGVLKAFSPVLDRSFQQFAPLNEQVSTLLRALVSKLGDSNKRTQREVSHAILRVVRMKKLRALPHLLLHLNTKDIAPRVRFEMVRQLVGEMGITAASNDNGKTSNCVGLTLEVVLELIVPALHAADDKTRKAVVELIAELQLGHGSAAVQTRLKGTVKPELLRVITRRVEELTVKHEKEQQEEQQRNANQAAEQHKEIGKEEEPPLRSAELVDVPTEDSQALLELLETQQSHAVSVIGPVVWRKLESKTWNDRRDTLVDLDKAIADAKSDLRDAKPQFGSVIQQNFASYCVVIHKCLADSIAPVVNAAMDCFATLVKVFGPYVEWREPHIRDLILVTITRLFRTMLKPNNRTNRAACRSVLKLTRLPTPHTLRYALSCIFAKDTDALVQMHLLRLLIPEFGFQQDGISPELVLAAVAPTLAHGNDKVRKSAIDVALCTQRLMGKTFVLARLQGVKPVTLKELEMNFVDTEIPKDGNRPQTVHASTSSNISDSSLLPPLNFAGGEQSRRLLHSAPVGVGKLQCTPPEDEFVSAIASRAPARRTSVLSNEEENLMDAILDGDSF